jgi:hypothetical protein
LLSPPPSVSFRWKIFRALPLYALDKMDGGMGGVF